MKEEEKLEEKRYYDNPRVGAFLDKLFDALLEVRQSIRDKESNETAVPKLKGLLMIMGRFVDLEVEANVRL